MAYLYNDPNQNQQQNQQGNQQAQPNQQTGAGGAGNPASSSGSAGSTAPKQVSAAPTSSGQFTNIQNFIRANQASNLGGRLGGQVAGVANQASKDVNAAQNQFQQQSQAGRVQYDPNAVNQAISNPTQYAGNDANVAAFQKMYSGQYTGPQGLGNQQQLTGEVNNAQQVGNLGSTEAGRFALLKNFYNKSGQYNQGQQTLDNLLIQADPTQAAALNQGRVAARQAQQQYNQANTGATQAAQQYGQEANTTNQQTQQALTGAQQNLTNTLQQQMQTQQGQVQSLADKLKEWSTQAGTANLSNPNSYFNQQELQLTGLKPGELTYNAPLNQYIQQQYENPANLQNTATADQITQMNALNKLANQGTFGDVSQAGTYLPNQFKTDTQGLNQYINTQTAANGPKSDQAYIQQEIQQTGQSYLPAAVNILNDISSIENGDTSNLSTDTAKQLAQSGATPDQMYAQMKTMLANEQQKIASASPESATLLYKLMNSRGGIGTDQYAPVYTLRDQNAAG